MNIPDKLSKEQVMNALQDIATLKPHIAIYVTDVAASTRFYSAMFGIEPLKERPGYAKFDVDNPPLNFTLNEKTVAGAGALSHLGIQVASTAEVAAIRDGWQKAGLLPRDEMNTICCYARQDKAWVKDPDGHEWEVFTVLEDGVDTANQGAACCPSPQAA